MPRQVQHCIDCQKLFSHGTKRCADSTGLYHKACKKFKAGSFFTPKFFGKKAKTIKFEAKESNAWCFWTSPTQLLLLAWEVDTNQRGRWRIFNLGIDDNGVIMKRFGVDQIQPAFYGEISVKGASQNDLFASLGFEDDDAVDYEKNVYNKPTEVVILPKRES